MCWLRLEIKKNNIVLYTQCAVGFVFPFWSDFHSIFLDNWAKCSICNPCGGTPSPNMRFWVLKIYQEIIKLAIFITQMTFKPQSATLIKPTTNWRTPAGLVEITFYSKSRQTVLNSAEEHFSAQLQKQCDRTLSQEKEVGKYREM